jgi:hypothetical protein
LHLTAVTTRTLCQMQGGILIDGGSSLNILFLKTFDYMGLSRSLLRPNQAPFHGIVLGAAVTPIDQITLCITFGT